MPRRSPSRPRRCLPWLLLLWCLPGVGAAWAADDLPVGEGSPFVQYFSARDYHGDPDCLTVVQDARGIVYVANQGSVLEYDGSTWRSIPTGDIAYTRGLAYDAGTDTVFVGCENDLGCLKVQPGGARTYVSLRGELAAGEMGSNYSQVHATPEGIYFAGTDRVHRWHGGRFKTWKLVTYNNPPTFWVAGHFYLASFGQDVQRLDGDEFVPVTDDPFFRTMDKMLLVSEADGSLLLGTHSRGFFALAKGPARAVPTECDAFFRQKGIYGGLRLTDGSLAVRTRKGGVVVLDAAHRFRCRVDKTTGLRSDSASGLYEDAEGGLWIGQEAGVARAEVNSPVSVIRAGPDDDLSTCFTRARWRGDLVLGGSDGIFRLAPADPAAATGPRVELLAGNLKVREAMCTVNNGVLASDGGPLVLVDDERRVVKLRTSPAIKNLMASRVHPGRVYATESSGRIVTLRREEATGKWIDDAVVAELGVASAWFQVLETPRGDLWVGTLEHGLFRVELGAAGGGAARVTSFFDAPGPLRGVGRVAPTGGSANVLETSRGLYRFDEETGKIEGLTEFGKEFSDGSLEITGVELGGARDLWMTFTDQRDPGAVRFTGRVVAGAGPGAAPVRQALPRRIEALIGEPSIIHPLEEGPEGPRSMLIVGTSGNGVVRLDLGKWEAQMAARARPFATLIRRAFSTGGEGAEHGSPILREPLEYARNTLRFEFAAGTLAFGTAPRFQTRLVGFGQGNWSAWNERASVDYLNLPEGRYTFEVRARNADGQTGSVASLPFRVLPPWQRSLWAYAGYALAAALALAGFVRWRGRQLRRRNAALETLVEARTGELRAREADLLTNQHELVRARDDAESANRAKSAFLANMSHELRTPLNAVLGYTQLLLKEDDLSPRSRERIAVIGQSGGHLLSLVNEVLDLSKIEAGKLTLSPFDFSLGQLLNEVAAAFRPRLAEKGLTYTETRAPGLPTTVRTDPSWLRQVLFNLLSNAVKFTHRGGVTLSVRPTAEGRVRFEVADTGVGLAPEDQRDIFLAFHQAGESRLASQGTGLGLTISQRLVGLLGGRIELESTPGHGSRFWFELPLLNAEPSNGSSPHASQDSALGKVTGYEGATRRVLLVDDLPENRRVLRDFLQPLGFEIEEAADGAGCLAVCARQTLDAVLLDLRLGTMNGFEVARILRARPEGTRLRIIAISASVFESDRQEAIDAGCNDFLPKPFEEAQLLGTLGRVLDLRWLPATPAVSEPSVLAAPAGGKETLPAQELDLLRELSLRGDVAGIRERLDARRAAGAPGSASEVVRRLDALAASYDLEGIDDLLLTLPPHGGN